MKSYQSIPRVDLINGWDRKLYTFDKVDGSQIRIQYSKAKGFYKFGSKKQLIDRYDPILGSAIPLFEHTLADPLTKVMRDNKWNDGIIFCEFLGDNSFAGRHNPNDPKKLIIFDVSIYKQGILPPERFLANFNAFPIPNFLGIHTWTPDFIKKIRNSEINGMMFEGAVGKVQYGATILMAKCKTQKWLDKVYQIHTQEEAEALINS